MFSDSPRYAIPRFFSNKKYQIKWAWQRVTRGYDDNWRWGLWHELIMVVIPNLKWLKEHHVGCPGNLYDKSKKDKECWKWETILEDMIKGFEAVKKIDEGFLFKGKEYNKLQNQYDKGMGLFVKYFRNLWD